MQSDDQLPLAAWGQALAAARAEKGLGVVETARELMMSPAQLRNIETGNMQSFHGSGYYFRAVQKYANRLGIVLEPAVESLPLTDSQLGMQRLNKSSSASYSSATATLSRRQSTLDNGLKVAPFRSRSSRVGMVLGVILSFAVALGVYLSIKEGWPNKQTSQTADGMPPQSQQSESVQAIAVPITPDLNKQTSVSAQSANPATPEPLLVSPTAIEAVAVIEPMAASSALPEPEPKPEPAPAAEPVPTPPPVDILEARFTGDCWVEVRYKDGRVEQKVYTERDILTVPVDEIEGVVFGNAAVVRAQRRGSSFDVMTYAGGRNVARISKADLR
jgi:cytoskeletal protein RodZ